MPTPGTKRRDVDGVPHRVGSPASGQENARDAANGATREREHELPHKLPIAKRTVEPPTAAAAAAVAPRAEETFASAMEALNATFAAFLTEQLQCDPSGDFSTAAREYVTYVEQLRTKFGLVNAETAAAGETQPSPSPATTPTPTPAQAQQFAAEQETKSPAVGPSSVAPAAPPPWPAQGYPDSSGFGSVGSSASSPPTAWPSAFAGSAAPPAAGTVFPPTRPFSSSSSPAVFGSKPASPAPVVAQGFGGFGSSSSFPMFGSLPASPAPTSGFSFGSPAAPPNSPPDLSYKPSPSPSPSFQGYRASNASYGASSIWTDPLLLQRRVSPSSLLARQQLIASDGVSEVWGGQLAGRTVAIKRLALENQTIANAIAVATTFKAIAELRHPNIVELVGVEWTNALEIQVVSEFLEQGDLRSLLDSADAGQLTWANFKCQVAIDIMEALLYLSNRFQFAGTASLTSRKVLLTQSGSAKFNLVRFSDAAPQPSDKGVSRVRWTAPEVIKGGSASAASDMYSFGVLLAELDTTSIPFAGLISPNGHAMGDALIAQQIATAELKPALSPECPTGIATLANECLATDPTRRATAFGAIYKLKQILKAEL